LRSAVLSVAEQKQPSSSLRNTEIGRIENVLADIVAKPFEGVDEFRVTWPRTHMDHVFDHDPSRPYCLGESQYLKRSFAAGLQPGTGTPCTTVIGALRRGQQKFNTVNVVEYCPWRKILDRVIENVSGGKVVLESFRCKRGKINAADNLRSSIRGSSASEASPAEHVKGTNQMPLHA
jgi:hypothetical protein